MTSIILGMPGAMMPDETAVQGRPYIVDAVSTFGEYAGDFARTLVLGEPTREILARARANRLAREAAFEIIKPGAEFSTFRDVAFNTLVKAGIPERLVFVTPHSVGLSHTDQGSGHSAVGGRVGIEATTRILRMAVRLSSAINHDS